MARTEFEQALMHRDGVTASQAQQQKQEARESIYDILEQGGGYAEVEELLAYEYGLEMDYIMDIL